MTLIHYIVLDLIMKNESGILASLLSNNLDISLSKLTETFNSLLKIKIIKRDNNSTDIKFLLNNNFSYEKNKISISELVKIKTDDKAKAAEREFVHDRNMIVLCNLINFAKKNKYFTSDTIITDLSYKVPFKLNDEYINKAIEKALSDEYIKEIKIPKGNDSYDIMYNYCDL